LKKELLFFKDSYGSAIDSFQAALALSAEFEKPSESDKAYLTDQIQSLVEHEKH
jgi:hypothetical protein